MYKTCCQLVIPLCHQYDLCWVYEVSILDHCACANRTLHFCILLGVNTLCALKLLNVQYRSMRFETHRQALSGQYICNRKRKGILCCQENISRICVLSFHHPPSSGCAFLLFSKCISIKLLRPHGSLSVRRGRWIKKRSSLGHGFISAHMLLKPNFLIF